MLGLQAQRLCDRVPLVTPSYRHRWFAGFIHNQGRSCGHSEPSLIADISQLHSPAIAHLKPSPAIHVPEWVGW